MKELRNPGIQERHRIGLGVVGLGHWGSNYVNTLLDIPSCRLAALVDSNPRALAQCASRLPPEGSRIRFYSGIGALLDDDAVSAVVVAAPDRVHFASALECLQAGRDVLVEKPLARSVVHAQRLLACALATGRVLACGHTALYQRGFDRLYGVVRNGSLGRILRVEAVRTSGGPAEPDGDYGALWDLAPHDLAMVIGLFGAPVSCRTTTGDPAGAGAEFELLFVDGMEVRCRVAWEPSERMRRFAVHGAHASQALVEEVDQRDSPADRPLGRQCVDFLKCCRDRSLPRSDAGLGLEVIRCLEALSESSRLGNRWVELNASSAKHRAYAQVQ